MKATPRTRRQENWAREIEQHRSPIKLVRQMCADIKRESESVFTQMEQEDREAFTAGEESRLDAIKADKSFLEEVRAEFEDLQEQERQAAARVPARNPSGPGYPAGGGDLYAGTPEAEALLGARLRLLQQKPFVGRSYRDLFGPPQRQNAFSSFNEFASVIATGQFHPGLIHAGMTEGMPSAGGFMVPEEYAAMLLNQSLEQEIIRPRAQVAPMKSATKKVGTFQNDDNSTSAPYGGLSLQWMEETGTIGLKEAKTRLITLAAKKAGMLVPVSNELLEDGTSFDEQLGNAIISSVGWGLDDAFLNGTGVGTPLGILNAPSLVTVTKETGQTAGSVVYENITKMYSRMHPACIQKAIWIANVTTVPSLLSLSIGVGTAGAWYPVLRETDGAFTMLGRPVLFTEKVPTAGAKGDILFVDLSQYVIGLRKDVTVDKS
ncbi:MAG: phage major capsid protein, partial [Candidatus Binatia bacterium]